MMGNLAAKSINVFFRFFLIIFFSIGAILLGGYAAFLAYQTIFAVPNVRVPAVLELELDAARQELYKTGLKMAVIDDNIFLEGEHYIVIKQRPPAGTELKKNRTVEVEIRAAQTFQQIPDLVGKSVEEAGELLSQLGLEIGDIAYTQHQKIAEGRIIAQEPPAGGQRSSAEGKINILISKGLY